MALLTPWDTPVPCQQCCILLGVLTGSEDGWEGYSAERWLLRVHMSGSSVKGPTQLEGKSSDLNFKLMKILYHRPPICQFLERPRDYLVILCILKRRG